MAQAARRTYSLEDYYDVELSSELKHEYFNGEIFAMAGGTTRHNVIAGNVFAALHAALRGSSCVPFGSDQRVTMPSGLYTYPDVSVFCGEVETADFPPHSAINAVALFEVLSDATRGYDLSTKFELYGSIASLRDYVWIEQTAMRVEVRARDDSGDWTTAIFTAPHEVLQLASLGVRVPLREIYERINFSEA